MISEALAAGVAYFVFVFFKAFQQRNVAHMHYLPVLPISYIMSAMEVFVIATVAYRATNMVVVWDMIPYVLTIGTGGGLGALAGMYVHHRHLSK